MRSPSRTAGRLASAAITLLLCATPPALAQEPVEPKLVHVSPGEGVTVMGAALSPDGRWLLFARMDAEDRASLWVMPTRGGAQVRLTSEGHWDGPAAWSPKGDRIFFSSSRPARAGEAMYGMVLPFDPASGRATGAPRQLTLEGVFGVPPQPSPDGRSIAYVAGGPNADQRIRVIPASGGNARTVAQFDQSIHNLRWSADGSSLYYHVRPGQEELRIVYRVPVSGGTPQEVFRVGKNIRAIGPNGNVFAVLERGPEQRQRTLEIVRADHHVLARFVVDENVLPTSFTNDGRTLIGTATRVTAPIRVVTTQGGRPVDVTDDTYYYWPAAWTADTEQVLVYAQDQAGSDVIVAVPRSGAQASRVAFSLPADAQAPRWWVAGREHALYTERVADSDRARLYAVSRRDGRRTLVSEHFFRPARTTIHAAGGAYFAGLDDRFLFLERHGDTVELRAVTPGSPSRVLRSFAPSLIGRTSFAVHGDRVAWYEEADGLGHLMLAADRTGEPRRLLSLPAQPNCCRFTSAFSHDGRYLVTYYRDEVRDDARLQILTLTEDGRLAGAPRVVELGADYWYEPQWLPDNSGLTVLAGYTGMLTHVMLVPNRAGEEPVILTRDDPSPKWGQFLSPDGRYVAYPAEVWQGGSIWTVDLSPVIAAASR